MNEETVANNIDVTKLITIGVIILVVIIIVTLITKAIRKAKRAINRTVQSAGRNLIDGAINAAFRSAGIDNAADVVRDMEPTPERISTASKPDFDKLYERYPEFNLDVYKLRAQTIVKTANTGENRDETLGYLTEEFKSNFNIKNDSNSFEVTGSGMAHYVDNQNNPKILIEVAYKLGNEYHKDEVIFSNMAEEDISGEAQRICSCCRAPYTELSLTQRRCEYCETPIALETNWVCISHKRLR